MVLEPERPDSVVLRACWADSEGQQRVNLTRSQLVSGTVGPGANETWSLGQTARGLGPGRSSTPAHWGLNDLLRDAQELLELVAALAQPPQCLRRVLQAMLHVDFALEHSRLHPTGKRTDRLRSPPAYGSLAQFSVMGL